MTEVCDSMKGISMGEDVYKDRFTKETIQVRLSTFVSCQQTTGTDKCVQNHMPNDKVEYLNAHRFTDN